MNKRTFNKFLRAISTKGALDISKITELPDEAREAMVKLIIRKRHPIVKELIPAEFDRSWLASMGYMYETTGCKYTFVHTCEQVIK